MRPAPHHHQTHCDDHSCSNEHSRVRHQTTTRMGQPPRLSWACVTPRGTTEHRAPQICLPDCNLRIGVMRVQHARANRVLHRQARHSDGYRHLTRARLAGSQIGSSATGYYPDDAHRWYGSMTAGEQPGRGTSTESAFAFPNLHSLEYCFRALGDRGEGETKK
jgi:hypothetical protein